MKHLAFFALPFLFACASSRHLAVGDNNDAAAPARTCAGDCHADVHCTPDGHCVISCDGPNGKHCEIEIDCSGATCTVVRCEGTNCGGSSACNKTKPE